MNFHGIIYCRFYLAEKRQEFKSPEGCQMFSTLVKTSKAPCKKFAKVFLCYNQMTNPAGFWQRPDLECADMSALWNDATCRVMGKRRRVAALQIKALPDFWRELPRIGFMLGRAALPRSRD
jgi:hypothetical protein